MINEQVNGFNYATGRLRREGKTYWRAHPTVADLEVSHTGRARLDGCELNVSFGNGYAKVRVRKHYMSVAHLVLEAWIGPKPAGFVAAHLNDDTKNNSVRNLAWIDTSANARLRSVNAPQKKHTSWLRETVRERGHSLADLARASDMCYRHLLYIETGVLKPSPSSIKRIAAGLGECATTVARLMAWEFHDELPK